MQPMVFYGNPVLFSKASVNRRYQAINCAGSRVNRFILSIINGLDGNRIAIHAHKIKLSILILKPDPKSSEMKYKLLN